MVPSRSTNVVPLTPVTASLNVAVRFPVWLTERAPEAGVRAVTVGATNSVRGVTAAERADAAPVPAALVAATSNVYAVPLVRPVTTAEDTVPATVCVRARVVPAKARTRYPVMAEPPLLAGAVHRTVAEAFAAVGVPIVGAPATVRGVTTPERAERGPVPTEFTAATSNV